jgi:hypothetical protein
MKTVQSMQIQINKYKIQAETLLKTMYSLDEQIQELVELQRQLACTDKSTRVVRGQLMVQGYSDAEIDELLKYDEPVDEMWAHLD